MAFLLFSFPVFAHLVLITGPSGMGFGFKPQFRDQSCGSCHADASMGGKVSKSSPNLPVQDNELSGFSFQDTPDLGYLTPSLGGPPGLQAALQKHTALPRQLCVI